jgi:hypothetical protein
MVGGFIGTLIGLERAVGISKLWAYAAPLLTASGSALLVVGPAGPLGPLFIALGSAVVVAVFDGQRTAIGRLAHVAFPPGRAAARFNSKTCVIPIQSRYLPAGIRSGLCAMARMSALRSRSV